MRGCQRDFVEEVRVGAQTATAFQAPALLVTIALKALAGLANCE